MKLSGCTGQPGTLTIGMPPGRAEVPAQVVGQAHAAGGVAGHGVDAAVGGAGADGDDGQRLGRQPVDPGVEGDGLARLRVVAHRGPVAVAVDVLVGDGALDDEDERAQLAAAAWRKARRKSSPVS